MFLILFVTVNILSRISHTKFLLGCSFSIIISSISSYILLINLEMLIWNFHVTSEKNVASNRNSICCDICNKWLHISCNNISRCCYWKHQKDSTRWYCKNCLKQVLPYNKLIDYQLKALMLGKVLTFPKLLSTNDYLLFPDEECENAAKAKLMTPDNICQISNNNSNNHFFHMNILSVSYHIDVLNTFKMNCKNKPKVIGIWECKVKIGRPPLANINYSYEYTPTESSKGGVLLYIDKNL